MKHLELFKQGFDSTLAEKVKVENWPYVGHDVLSGEVVYTAIPTQVEGPADNEIWYTTVDDEPVRLVSDVNRLDANYVTSNTYSNGLGKLQFEDTLIGWEVFNDNNSNSYYNLTTLFGRLFAHIDEPWKDTVTSNLKTIILPASITTLRGMVFLGCDKLESITFLGTKEQWNKIDTTSWYLVDEIPDQTYISSISGDPWAHNNIVSYIPATVIHCTDGEIEI